MAGPDGLCMATVAAVAAAEAGLAAVAAAEVATAWAEAAALATWARTAASSSGRPSRAGASPKAPTAGSCAFPYIPFAVRLRETSALLTSLSRTRRITTEMPDCAAGGGGR